MSIQPLVRQNVLKLNAYSSARSEYSGQAEVFLDANENPFNTGLNRYPDPLARELKKELGFIKNIDPNRIFLGNGSDEVIDLLIRIFVEPSDEEVIIMPPTYGMYKVCADLSNVWIKEVPLGDDFQPIVNAVLGLSSLKSKMLFICSPNNPTGNTIDRDKIVGMLKRFPGIVVIDEAYIDFANAESCIELLDQYPNLVVMQTFSKAWGLAGIRLGMAFASEEIIALLNKVKPPYNVNQLTQEAALKALKSEAEKDMVVQTILEERDWLAQNLDNLQVVERVYPSEANFLLIKVADPKGLYNFLLEKQIIVRDRSNVRLCDGCLRITVGTPDENRALAKAMLLYQVN